MASINMTARRFAAQLPYAALALALLNFGPSRIMAQEAHMHPEKEPQAEMTVEQKAKSSALLTLVREATERFKDVKVAEAAGYALQFGCVSGDASGAMGLHYVNGNIVNSGILDVNHPQIVIYESTPSGELKLTGADYLLMADAWNAKHSGPPELMGQLFHLFDAPNRFGLPAFYTLHVWAWKDNPQGAFVNWHPKVSCDTYVAKQPQ